MPKETRVERCYQKLKGTKGKASAAAICQSSTKQSLKTGKSLEETEMSKNINEISKILARKALSASEDPEYENVKDSKRNGPLAYDLKQRIKNKWGTKELRKAEFKSDLDNYGKKKAKTWARKKIDESRRSDKRAEREDPDVRAKARRDRVIVRLKAHGVVKTKEGRFRTNDKGEKERVDEGSLPARLRVRDLAKGLATPKPRSMETDSKPLLPSKNELAAGWKNDKAKLAKTGSYIMKKIGMNEEELNEELQRQKMVRMLSARKTGRVGKNLHITKGEDGTHYVELHKHKIIALHPDGSHSIHGQGSVTGGKPSVTTKRHINAWQDATGHGRFGHSKHVFIGPDGKEAKTNDWIHFKAKNNPLSEEELNELKKETLRSYISKAHADSDSSEFRSIRLAKPGTLRAAKKASARATKREKGITNAKWRLRGEFGKGGELGRNPWGDNYEYQFKEENDMDNDPTSNLVNALVDKDALGVKDAFADAMQNHILPDMLETEKERIAQTIIPQEDNDDDISDEEMDAFFDGLSDEELDEIMDAISSEEIPDEDFEGNVDDDSEEFDVDEK